MAVIKNKLSFRWKKESENGKYIVESFKKLWDGRQAVPDKKLISLMEAEGLSPREFASILFADLATNLALPLHSHEIDKHLDNFESLFFHAKLVSSDSNARALFGKK
jgi:hypothetical protein